jgi:hypothetical protein
LIVKCKYLVLQLALLNLGSGGNIRRLWHSGETFGAIICIMQFNAIQDKALWLKYSLRELRAARTGDAC